MSVSIHYNYRDAYSQKNPIASTVTTHLSLDAVNAITHTYAVTI